MNPSNRRFIALPGTTQLQGGQNFFCYTCLENVIPAKIKRSGDANWQNACPKCLKLRSKQVGKAVLSDTRCSNIGSERCPLDGKQPCYLCNNLFCLRHVGTSAGRFVCFDCDEILNGGTRRKPLAEPTANVACSGNCYSKLPANKLCKGCDCLYCEEHMHPANNALCIHCCMDN
jgi:hypothetical protein